MVLMYPGKSYDEILNLFQNLDSTYNIQIERDGKILNYDLNIQTTEFENTTSKIYEEDEEKIGYIKFEGFTFTSYEDFKKKFDELNNSNITSLILDLRNNLGGEEENMIDIASLFLSRDKVIFKQQTKSKEEIIYSKGENNINYPLVILVNNNTASCSEILTLALKEGCNATVIGTQTYGKGVGQTMYSTNKYSYKFTSHLWTSPSGVSINGVGITPDIVVENSNNDDLQLQKAKEYIKSLR